MARTKTLFFYFQILILFKQAFMKKKRYIFWKYSYYTYYIKHVPIYIKYFIIKILNNKQDILFVKYWIENISLL